MNARSRHSGTLSQLLGCLGAPAVVFLEAAPPASAGQYPPTAACVDCHSISRSANGTFPLESEEARPLEDIVPVDIKIYGCPIKKEEVEKIVTNLVLGKSVSHPKYPVCMECMANENICLYKLGEPCLGPVTRAGCDAWCPGSRFGCWGCRGPADAANVDQIISIMEEHNFSADTILDRLECFGGFKEFAEELKKKNTKKSLEV